MPVTSADIPVGDNPVATDDKAAAADKPESKAKVAPTKKAALADAAASSDPAVQKLMWDRGHRDPEDPHIAVIDAELRKLGFDI
jgi:hypothetical protein